MSFSELRAFLVVAEMGSFLAASVALGESRTTLRRQVDALEARAGVPLLHRDRKGVSPTDAGLRLLASGRVMQRDFEDLLSAIRETGSLPTGGVRVLLPVGLPIRSLTGLLALLNGAFPRLQFRMAFYDGPFGPSPPEADVVVYFGPLAPPGAWERRTVTSTQQRLLASEDYLQRRGTPSTLDDLRTHDLLLWTPPDDPDGRIYLRSNTAVVLPPLVSSGNIDLLHASARMGTGIAWVPDADLPQTPGEAPLVRVLDNVVGREVSVDMAVSRRMADLPKGRVFLEQLDLLRQVAHLA
ncbi:MAG: LysR family transcriptional regulator [Bradymonadia bacterium]